MAFWLFRKACKKYHCCYALSNSNGLVLFIKPHFSLDNIECRKDNYFDLFITAIKLMKKYNNK